MVPEVRVRGATHVPRPLMVGRYPDQPVRRDGAPVMANRSRAANQSAVRVSDRIRGARHTLLALAQSAAGLRGPVCAQIGGPLSGKSQTVLFAQHSAG